MFENSISTTYCPTEVEPHWYRHWIETNCFHADETSSAPAYSIVIPPPNVTGFLTLGHVLNNTIQDILARRARQTGHEVLWLPGTDHAGIATQAVVERQLKKEEKKTRHDLGRAAFLERVWEWKQKHGGIIIEQLKRLGCSCDWGRERFTMDEAYGKKVQETFVDLYNKGLIYRGKRMVHWCPVSLTALSDEEVIPKKQKSLLYYFKLEIVEESGTWLEIATTRPETIMGDVALAVNPNDPRYKRFIGMHVRRPLPAESELLLPIIGDTCVDMQFGTGVLKITPAHDLLDYEIGTRHNLPIIDIMNPDGTLNTLAGSSFAGMDRFEARIKAAQSLRELGLLVKEEVHENNVGFSERADVPIEPRLSEQWFLKYPKTKEAQMAVQKKLTRFFPERWEKVYDHWLEHIQDWCISRQLWWGHQIPAWYSAHHGEIKVQMESPGPEWTQDPDVLDTWFSSWLWAHETMDVATLKKFYPTSVLVTGPDIIFFWVARMMMASLEYTGKLPFRDVYFTGIIRDKSGRKMSKSLGNSPDPLDLIAKYGADALRFGIMRMAPHGQDVRFEEKIVEEGRNFANKLWNAARFRQMHGICNAHPELSSHELPDIAITLLYQFDRMHHKLLEAYQEYRFQEMTLLLYHFFWNDYCDWFVEAAKPTLYNGSPKAKETLLAVIDYVFSGFLRLLHPFMPYITEEIWKRLEFEAPSSHRDRPPLLLYIQPPGKHSLSHLSKERILEATERTEALYGAIRAARNLRAELKINPKQAIPFLLAPKQETKLWSDSEVSIFSSLARATEVTILTENPPKESASVLTECGTITIPLEGLIDIEAEQKRLHQEIQTVESELIKVRSKLTNPDFVAKVPTAVLGEHQQREERWMERLTLLQGMLENR
ncbi:MAG: valine--tRNA ligase [Verrucomicrobia bacterium]|nr:MAG: valine--tRNA ligase [Verrucomicrobiota bacterium]